MNAQPEIIQLGEQPQQKRNAMVEIEASKAIQEIQASLIIAKRFPRDEDEAAMKILNSCLRPALAEEGLYEYSRGGTPISGPSIRLAEVMARSWGNVKYGWRELERRGGVSTLQAFCWDQETNVTTERVFDVKQVRNTKKGSYPLTDERDIYENNANNAARRMRKCILDLIPGDIVDAAVERCEKTIAEQATDEKKKLLVDAFAKHGVNRKMIETRIQRNVDSITGSKMVELRRIYVSLKDGVSDIGQWFDLTLSDAKPETQEKETNLDKFKDKAVAAEVSQLLHESNKQLEDMPFKEGPGKQPIHDAAKVDDAMKKIETALKSGKCASCDDTGLMDDMDPKTGQINKIACVCGKKPIPPQGTIF